MQEIRSLLHRQLPFELATDGRSIRGGQPGSILVAVMCSFDPFRGERP